jgi:hypothetical protein
MLGRGDHPTEVRTAVMMSAELEILIRSQYGGIKRSTADFVLWVENCLRMAADLPNHEEYLNHRELKKVRQEAFPLRIFLENEVLPVIAVEPSAKEHANHDAKLFLRDGSWIHAEVTFAKDGEFDLFQGQHMDKFGYGGIFGISKREMKNAVNNNTAIFGEAVDASETIQECLTEIHQRIAAKLAKKYPPDTILIIAIADDFREESWLEIVRRTKVPSQNTFTAVYMIGVNLKKCEQIV